jgi:hypothetical protein
VNRDKLRRLAALEEEDAKQQPGGAGRSKPGHHDVMRALDQGWEAWRELMRSHGWTDEQLDEAVAWDVEVNRRCDQANFEPWQVIRDMCEFVEAQNLPIGEQRAAFDRYPGPRPYWGPGGEG